MILPCASVTQSASLSTGSVTIHSTRGVGGGGVEMLVEAGCTGSPPPLQRTTHPGVIDRPGLSDSLSILGLRTSRALRMERVGTHRVIS